MKPQNASIITFRGKEGFCAIKDDWDRVTQSMKHRRFYHLYHWYESYIDAFESDGSALHFYVTYRGNDPVAVFPLKKLRRKLLGVMVNALEIPDHPNIDLSDFIVAKEEERGEVIALLINHLKEEAMTDWDLISLPHLPEDSPVFRFFEIFPSHLFICGPAGKCDYILCSPNEEIHSRISRNFSGNLRKARNKLMREENVEFVSARKGPQLYRYFEEFLGIESSGWKGEEGTGTAIKGSPERMRFYRNLLEKCSETNGCEVNLLRIKGECIAGQFCLLVDDVIYVLKIGYNEEYSRLAPGNMLLENLIQRVSRDETIRYVNLTTGSKWHQSWKPLSYNVFRAYIFNRTYAGLTGYMLTRGKILYRSLCKWPKSV